MTNFVAIADIHFDNADSWGVQTESGLNSRDIDRLEIVRSIVQYSITNSVDFVIFLGDVFNTSRPVERLKAAFYLELAPLFHSEIPVYILCGNHELGAFDNAYSSIFVLTGSEKYAPYLHIILEPSQKVINGFKFSFIPWVKNATSFFAENSEYIENFDVIFSHLEIQGATMGKHEYISKDGLPRDLFKNKYVLLGHYHKPQKVGDKIWYVGSMDTCNFGENTHPHGFVHCLLTSNDFDNSVDMTVNFKQTAGRPFIEHIFDGVPSENEITEFSKSLYTSNKPVVKIILHSHKDILRSSKMMEAIKSLRKQLNELASTFSIEERIIPAEKKAVEITPGEELSVNSVMHTVFTDKSLYERAIKILENV